ncbi:MULTISPECIES: PTS sugar transporter subunit IIA [Rathayibacter]|jgi:PTS system fructose-specific IIA component|uniref:PTS fructose transporter subunit IIA n=1 Tax=Rathayibacter caricis DSM 15933 TaxID=1328867 RepID=A0A2T4UUU7_9MICO|nr:MULTISPECIES: PTS sugar transporter subunit IIA [Rathayibacter]KQQ22749.1 PTS fructose transporter subunit IIA [Rathayibacter sp. Leaf299]OOB89978.1 PTS fructose transporter subunit IIA [Rathayibacter sp. VKM Ac-2630]PTL73297.1 PTS fructose transporter subunit IIA [Rathayibacter caricis DSM 15933]
MTALTEASTVIVDLTAATKDEATAQLAKTLADAGRVTDLDGFLADVRDREAQMATGMPGGIGIPHARSSHVVAPSVAVGIAKQGVDFGAPDGPADLIFLIAAPDGADQAHLKILAQLARKLIHESFTGSLRAASSGQEVADIIAREVVVS